MKFAIIGLGGPNTFSLKMEKALKKQGHSVYLLKNNEIKARYCVSKFKLEYHIYQKNPMDLREILPVENYDMIIISHSDFVFNNPKIGSTKVFYYHREMGCYPSCMNPDIMAYNYPVHDSYIWHYYPKLWHSTEKLVLNVAIDPEEFNPNREKDLVGLNYSSPYEGLMEEKRDFLWNYLNEDYMEREKKFTENGCRYNGERYVSYKDYKDYLERSEAFLIFTLPFVYGSRRTLESAICKTLPIIYIENKEAERYYNNLGFFHQETCNFFGDDGPIMVWQKKEEIIKNAYDLVLERHTYDHRANQIIELLQ